MSNVVAIAGAGGFIGGHLVTYLGRRKDASLRCADIKQLEDWHQLTPDADNRVMDLSHPDACREFVEGADVIYNLACDMGGMGFIEHHPAHCMLSVLINTHLLKAASIEKVRRYFFASSACVYPTTRQDRSDSMPLREDEVYPALPEEGYGWEKLFSEQMCLHFRADFGLDTRIGRFHNIYGPYETWRGGREKAPAALCRKVAEGKISGSGQIEIWGDGEQTRSFTFIDDCLKGIQLLMNGGFEKPVNIGSSEKVSINQMLDLIEEIAGTRLKRHYTMDAPQGVRGRSSDNSLIRKLFDWEPSVRLAEGLKPTYAWIEREVQARALASALNPVSRGASL